MGQFKYKTCDAALFVGLMTMPFGKEQDFFENEIKKGLFKSYKQWLIARLKDQNLNDSELNKKKEFDDYFYEPSAYCMFGNFDLAVVSLVDDFSFGTQVFRPFSNIMDNYDPEKDHSISQEEKEKLQSKYRNNNDSYFEEYNFTFKIINGIIPEINKENLVQKSKETFLKPNKKPNFIGITSLKINNSLLIGTGMDLLHPILFSLKKYLKPDVDHIPIQSFYWGEISILFFSDNLKEITESIINIRKLTFLDILNDIESNDDRLELLKSTLCYNIEFRESPNVSEEDLNKCLSYFNDNQSFISEQESHSNETQKYIDGLLSSHLFVNTYSRLGFDLNLLYPTDTRVIKNEEITLDIKWNIKPGHSLSAKNAINSYVDKLNQYNIPHLISDIGNNKIELTAGKGDLYTQNLSFENYLSFFRHLYNEKDFGNSCKENPFLHIRNISTSLYYEEEISDWNTVPKAHFYDFIPNLKMFCFSANQIKKVSTALLKRNISRVIANGIENMFIQYNDGIQDPVLYGYFIELRGLVESVYEKITKGNYSGIGKAII